MNAKISRRARKLTPKPQKLRHKGNHPPSRDVYGRRLKGLGARLIVPLMVGVVFAAGLIGGVLMGRTTQTDPSVEIAQSAPPPAPAQPVLPAPKTESTALAETTMTILPPENVLEAAPSEESIVSIQPSEVQELPPAAAQPPAPAHKAELPSEIADARYTTKSIDVKAETVQRNIQLASLPSARSMPFSGPGQPPWKAFAVHVPPPNGRPRIAIVIDDLGLDRLHTQQISDLPGPLTTAFLTYAEDLDRQVARAKSKGHELIIHVPMEPKDQDIDPGPDVLRTSSNEKKLRQQLDDIFKRFNGFVGINNHMGSRFTSDPKAMAVVMDEVRKRGLLFLDSRTSTETVGPVLAERYGVPLASRHVFLDNEPDPKYVLGQLYELEAFARRHGYAVGIGHPRAWTVQALRQWLPTLEKRGFQLVPISAIALQHVLAHGPT